MAGERETGMGPESGNEGESSPEESLTAQAVGTSDVEGAFEVAGASEVDATPGATASTAPQTTNAGRVWVAIAVAVVLLVLLIIFIAENSGDVTISFLGTKGTLSLALAMLISAVAGVLITLLVGTARIMQLRREVRRHKRRLRAAH
jgi:uncharacterized integral membrane protein